MGKKVCPVCDTLWDTQRMTCSWKKCKRAKLIDITAQYNAQLAKEAEAGRRIRHILEAEAKRKGHAGGYRLP